MLLQNVGGSIWNAISTLTLLISDLKQFESREANLAAVYGLALRPLYFVADALVDMLMESKFSLLPQASPLVNMSVLDDSNEVGVAMVKRIVFLAIHTLYVHQHWEKVVTLGLHFDNATR